MRAHQRRRRHKTRHPHSKAYGSGKIRHSLCIDRGAEQPEDKRGGGVSGSTGICRHLGLKTFWPMWRVVAAVGFHFEMRDSVCLLVSATDRDVFCFCFLVLDRGSRVTLAAMMSSIPQTRSRLRKRRQYTRARCHFCFSSHVVFDPAGNFDGCSDAGGRRVLVSVEAFRRAISCPLAASRETQSNMKHGYSKR